MSTGPYSATLAHYCEQATGPWPEGREVWTYAFCGDMEDLTNTLLLLAREAQVAQVFESQKPQSARDGAVTSDIVHAQELAREALRAVTERLGGRWTNRASLLLAASEAHAAIDARRAWLDSQLA